MKPCPCGSKQLLSACCLRFIDGPADPPSAGELMRSRYTAHALGKIPYILATCHPSIRRKQDALAIARWCDNSEFMRLEVLETKAGGVNDEEGTVQFIAWILEKGQFGGLHECSTFTRHEGLWTYLGGRHLPVKMPGVNDPCPCGTERKFKNCCGAL
jgi:SEC-C motif-containing protein